MKRRSTKFWYKNEKEVMKKLGLKPTPGSGSGDVFKEDGYNDFVLCQLKSTDANQIAIKRLDVEKLMFHSDTVRKVPVFVLQFINGPLLIATVPDEIGNLSKYLNNELFEKAKPIEIVEHEQGEIKKIKGKQKTVDDIIYSAKFVENVAKKNETISDLFAKRREREKLKCKMQKKK